jgi:hypothetical protein
MFLDLRRRVSTQTGQGTAEEGHQERPRVVDRWLAVRRYSGSTSAKPEHDRFRAALVLFASAAATHGVSPV